jgi:signal peptidase II
VALDRRLFSLYRHLFYGFLIVAFDQASKYAALQSFLGCFSCFYRFFIFPPVINHGVSFDFLSINSLYLRLIFFFLFLILFFLEIVEEDFIENHSMTLVLFFFGAISNILDYFLYGGVVDFIFFKVPYFNYFAVGNVADVSIFIATCFFLFDVFLSVLI